MTDCDKIRLKSLDVLRGLAILLVLIKHQNPATVPNFSSLTAPIGFAFWKICGKTRVEFT